MQEPITREELARQIIQHAESLRAAGVTFLPTATALTLPLVSAPAPAPEPVPIQPTVLPLKFLAEATALETRTVEQRQQELQALRQRVATCERCPHLAATRTQTVFGVGPLDPELCIIGEAPGEDEDRTGEPFVGAAGQLLNRILTAMGLKREEVYICNILRCRPPGNRTPNAEEAAHCREYLERTLELVRPKYICAMGACAAQNLLGTTTGIGRLRGRMQQYKDVPVLCTYHPAYLLPHRFPEKKKEVWEDMKFLLAKMGRAIPGK